MKSLQRFMPTSTMPGRIYTDKSLVFNKAHEDLAWTHDTSTPHRPPTQRNAERAARQVKEGTAAELVKSGITDEWWKEAMECYRHLRNAHDAMES